MTLRYWVFVGNSGSGKTTLAEWLASELDAQYVSADELRFQLTGDEINQSQNSVVFWIIEETLNCPEADDVVVDLTNANFADRQKLLGWCHGDVYLVHVTTPLQTCIDRQRGRARQVDEYALVRMDEALRKHPPALTDGSNVCKLIRV